MLLYCRAVVQHLVLSPPFHSTANVQEPTTDVVLKTYDFIHTLGTTSCHEVWTSWPAVHKSAMNTGTVLMFRVFPSIGNLFITLGKIIKVIHSLY